MTAWIPSGSSPAVASVYSGRTGHEIYNLGPLEPAGGQPIVSDIGFFAAEEDAAAQGAIGSGQTPGALLIWASVAFGAPWVGLAGAPQQGQLAESHIQAMVKQIGRKMGLTTLRYQRLDDMVKAIGLPREKLCTYCWNGCDKPVKCDASKAESQPAVAE